MLILENPTLLSSSTLTVGAYIQEKVFGALGMDGTYFVLPDGTNPLETGNLTILTNKAAVLTTSNGAVSSSVPLYAGYTADFMLRTTAADVSKLMNALFQDSTSSFYPIGLVMIGSLTTVSISQSPQVQTMQGFGIIAVDPATLCNSALAYVSMPAGCSAVSTVFGFGASGSNTQVSGLCTASPISTPTTVATYTCVSATVAFTPSSPLTLLDTVYSVAVASLNNEFINSAVYTGTTLYYRNQLPDSLFAGVTFACFMAIVISIAIGAYFLEFFIHPMRLTGPMISHANPTLEEYLDRTASMGR
jgi:CubicO group peptidase (beta-lactamase class C family)